MSRAAEVSTGFICVCVPTLAALARRRGPAKPTRSILNGQLNGNWPRSGRRPSSLDLCDRIEMLPDQMKLGAPPVGVVTGIEGGVRARDKEHYRGGGSIDASGEERGGGGAMGIMTTVSIEQTCV